MNISDLCQQYSSGVKDMLCPDLNMVVRPRALQRAKAIQSCLFCLGDRFFTQENKTIRGNTRVTTGLKSFRRGCSGISDAGSRFGERTGYRMAGGLGDDAEGDEGRKIEAALIGFY